jgi:predicted Rossmann-fold nucleotide-binding protein
LGYHDKPCGFLNVAGYYDQLISFLDASVAKGFVRANHRAMVAVETDIDMLITGFDIYTPPHTVKWVGPGQT